MNLVYARLFSYDPGGTTGWSMWTRREDGLWELSSWGTFELWGPTPEFDPQTGAVKSPFPWDSRTIVVVESVTYQYRGFETKTFWVEGVLHWWAEVLGAWITRQPPSAIRSLRQELPLKGLSPHSRDAIYHAVSFLRRFREGIAPFPEGLLREERR